MSMDAHGPAEACSSCDGLGLEGYKPCPDCFGTGVEDRPQVEDRRAEPRPLAIGRVAELHDGRTTLVLDDGDVIHVEIAQQVKGERTVTVEHSMMHGVSLQRQYGRAVITILGDK